MAKARFDNEQFSVWVKVFELKEDISGIQFSDVVTWQGPDLVKRWARNVYSSVPRDKVVSLKHGTPYWQITSSRDHLATRMVDVPQGAKYLRVDLHYPVLYGTDCGFIVLLQDQDLNVIGRAECDRHHAGTENKSRCC